MERGEIKHAVQSGMWFDELLIHDPDGEWNWFWKSFKGAGYRTYRQASNAYSYFRKENKDEISKRMGQVKEPYGGLCQFCLLARCICDSLARM